MVAVVCENHPTLLFAARELCRLVNRMTGTLDANVMFQTPDGADAILLEINPALGTPDPALDDAFDIQLNAAVGKISGSNPRAVLLGVYAACRAVGCRFIRPGTMGEVVPHRTKEDLSVSLHQAASFRHRGAVIEGADSVENVLDFIDWLPKVGYNSFFTQFMSISNFLRNWYCHIHNPLLPAEPFDETICQQYEAQIWAALRQRSLLHHAVGHGWTCEPVGIQGRGWDEVELEIPPETEALLAMVDGKRQLFHKIPALTNLCYSNPIARGKICDFVVEYLRAHPGIDYLNFWLADSIHSFCECENCRGQSPSDWYLLLLNQLDERLTAEGLDTRLVFLIYYDLLFPPKVQQFKNPDRFVLMFAPISRPFSHSFADFQPAPPPEEFQLNQTPIPQSIEENLACLKAWQQTLKAKQDSFDFDYHLGRAHYGDPGYCAISRILDRDIDQLPQLGLNGILSCQELRAFFPTGLPNYLMAAKLWDSSRGYEEIAQEYFTAAFGAQGGAMHQLLEEVSRCFETDYWFRGKALKNPELAARMKNALTLADRIDDLCRCAQTDKPPQQLSWQYMTLYGRYLRLYTKAMAAVAEGQQEEAAAAWKEFCTFLCTYETVLQPVMDVFRIQEIARHTFFPS